jgi:hypothetical protein
MSYERESSGGGSQSIADEFFAGNYAAIVRELVDGAQREFVHSDLPFVVGALAFVGRLEEARALLASRLRDRSVSHDAARIVAARFFLGVAFCRAGRMEDARSQFLMNVRSRHGVSLVRFYAFQGLGCYRYFSGRLRRAARLALHALEHAFAARFPYGRLLATDLRGHALVQLGQVQNGLSVLETARTLAAALSLVGNVGALACATAIYRARFGVLPLRRAIEALDLLADSSVLADSYSERSVRLELAVQTALAGDAGAAWRMLERLGTERVPDGGDARTKIRFLLACAHVVRLRHGAASMRPFVSEARAMLAQARDIVLEIDVSCMELVATTEPETAARIRAELSTLCEQSGIDRAWLRHAVSASEPAVLHPPGAEALEQDRLGALYAACRRGSPGFALGLLDTGHVGLLPVALGLEPGRRLLVIGRRLVVEDCGNVSVIGEPPEGTLRFVSALAGGARRSKEELLALVWGIASYRPAAHDAVIHTAVSRVRAQLGPQGHWVEAALGGYRLASGVEVVHPFEADRPARPPADPPASSIVSLRDGERESVAPASHARAALLALLAANGATSSREVASHLGVSEMTALRRLREYVEEGAISRHGKGKNTRYQLLRSVS